MCLNPVAETAANPHPCSTVEILERLC
jgi:hypothetical protein